MITKVDSAMLTCDGCEDVYTDSRDFSIFTDIAVAEECAEDEGWVKSVDKHYCPDCHRKNATPL